MQIPRKLKAATLALAVLAFVAPVASAQSDFHTRDSSSASKKHAKDAAAALFPNATRAEPNLSVSESLGKPINDLLAMVNSRGHEDEVIATGQTLLQNKEAQKFDRAVIEQAIGYAYLNKPDAPKGIEYLQKSIAEDALSNNDQYQLMLVLCKAQIAADQTDAGLATLTRVVTETRQDKPEYDGIRGRALYAKKDFAGAAQSLQKALDSSPQPDSNVQQLLMASYLALKQPERAEKFGEDIVHAHPDDKTAIMNLADIYLQADQTAKAVPLLEDARKRGLFTSSDDYRSLYSVYSNMKGHESDSAAVINEGLQKGILTPTAEVYTQLAQDYYFMSQTPQAIEAYKKADAVSSDGEASMNLARIYSNEGRMAEAKAAAERALQKGVKDSKEARDIIDRANGSAGKKAGKKK